MCPWIFSKPTHDADASETSKTSTTCLKAQSIKSFEINYTCDAPDHGRIETRNIWVSTALNEYLNFPHVGQVFMVERISYNKKTGKETRVIAYGITSKTPDLATAEQVLRIIENTGASKTVVTT